MLSTKINIMIVICANIQTVYLYCLHNDGNYGQYMTDSYTYLERCIDAKISCTQSRYRTIDGTCNNLRNPLWGKPPMTYDRLFPFKYGDGVFSFPTSTSGHQLPNARQITVNMFPNNMTTDRYHSLITMQWGQTVSHDLSNRLIHSAECCNSRGGIAKDSKFNPKCAPIHISRNDPIFGPEGKTCMNFVRTKSVVCRTKSVSAQPLSSVTPYLDLSLVYGSTEKISSEIREGNGGQLRTVFINGAEMLPNNPTPSSSCLPKSSNTTCLFAGDDRVNQNPELALIQTLLVREHNRIAKYLCKTNPHWNDKTLFQEARKILIAIYQHITYYEYLPILIGRNNMLENYLIYDLKHKYGYINDYNPKVNPSVYVEHASAAFKLFHSTIRGYLQKYEEKRKILGEIRLSNSFNNPFVIVSKDNFDNFARGLVTQLQRRSSQYFDEEISNFLFRGEHKYGLDLPAIDIQRGRDHGLASYIDARAACDLSVPKKFSDMLDYISYENVQKLKNIYEDIKDVDLMVAGVLEFHVPNTLAGPTFVCIITKQFLKTRICDRYFYENGENTHIAFTLSQLQSIRQGASMARLFCDNTESINSMQPKAFLKISNKNKLVSCEHLPEVDLSLWKE